MMDNPTQKDTLAQPDLLGAMREKETGELVAIWQENDRELRSDEASEAARAVLLERLGEAPVKGQPDGKEDVMAGYATMFRVGAWAKTVSWLVLAIGGSYVLLNLVRFVLSVASSGAVSQIPITDLLSGILGVLYSVLQVGFFFLVLQGISEMINFLFDRWL